MGLNRTNPPAEFDRFFDRSKMQLTLVFTGVFSFQGPRNLTAPPFTGGNTAKMKTGKHETDN
jgi:hypothetical protein